MADGWESGEEAVRERIAGRLEYRRRIGRDGRLRALELARCAGDPVYWCDHWAWTYDPRAAPASQPFVLFPMQARLMEWLRERESGCENGLIEKSRDSGATYVCAAYALHAWLFREGFSAGFGSRKLNLVDTIGDPDSIFEKLRIVLRNLPVWMQPDGFDWRRHDNSGKLLNPANGSSITGEGGDDIGRGGRKSIYFVDEFAFVEHPRLIDAALSQTTRVRIDLSTPNGAGNAFYEKRHSGAVAVFTFHWKDDPRKNHWEAVTAGEIVLRGSGWGPKDITAASIVRWPWYETEKARLNDDVIVAQELDIDYAASAEGVCIPAKWVQCAVELPVEPSGAPVLGLDVAAGGKNETVLIGRRGPKVFPPATHRGNGTEAAHWAADIAESCGASALHFDAAGVGYAITSAFEGMSGLHFTPHGVLGGARATDEVWPNGRAAHEMFANYRAELYCKLRARFEKTFEFVAEGVAHPMEELISIPNDAELVRQLSIPQRQRTSSGKWKIESKEEMRKRGIASPDRADALAYSEAGEAGAWEAMLLSDEQMADYERESVKASRSW